MKTSWIDWSSFQLHRIFVLYRSKVHLPGGSFCFWFLAWRCSGNLAIHQHRNYSLPTSGQGRSWVQNKLWHEMMYMDHMDGSCEKINLLLRSNVNAAAEACDFAEYHQQVDSECQENISKQLYHVTICDISYKLHCGKFNSPNGAKLPSTNVSTPTSVPTTKQKNTHEKHSKVKPFPSSTIPQKNAHKDSRKDCLHVQVSSSITASLCLHQHKHGQGYRSESSPLETHGQMHAVHVFGNSWSSLCTFTTFSRQTFGYAYSSCLVRIGIGTHHVNGDGNMNRLSHLEVRQFLYRNWSFKIGIHRVMISV